MSIEAAHRTCPTCGTGIPVSQVTAGNRVCCEHCGAPLLVPPDEPVMPPTPVDNDAATSPSARFVPPLLPAAPTAPDRARNAESRTKTSEEISEDVLSWLEEQRDSSHSLPTEANPQDGDGDSARTCPACNAALAHDALICIQCGYDRRTGAELQTEKGVPPAFAAGSEPDQPAYQPSYRDKPVVSMFAAFFGREVHAAAIVLTVFALLFVFLPVMLLRGCGTMPPLRPLPPEDPLWMMMIITVVWWLAICIAEYPHHFMILCALGAGADTSPRGFIGKFLAGFVNLVPVVSFLFMIPVLAAFGPVAVVFAGLAATYYYCVGMTVAALKRSLAPGTVLFWMFVCLPGAVLLFPLVSAIYSVVLVVVVIALAAAFPFLSLPDHPLVLAALFGIPCLYVFHLALASRMFLLGRLARLKQAELGWGGEVAFISLAGRLRSRVVLSAIVGTALLGAYLFAESNRDKISARESLPTPKVWLREVLGQLGLPTGPETESPPSMDAAVPEDPSGQLEASGGQGKPIRKTPKNVFPQRPNEPIPRPDQREKISLEDATMHQSPSSLAAIVDAETSTDAHQQPAPRATDPEDAASADVAGIFLRTWTDRTGKFQVRAEFQSYDEPTVTLKKADGSVIAVPLARLSSEDQDFVLDYVQRRKHLESKRTPQP